MTSNTSSMNLLRLSELTQDSYISPVRSEHEPDLYNPVGHYAYGSEGERIGSVCDTLLDVATGQIRFFLVDIGGWFRSKKIMVPVGLARPEEDGIYFDDLSRESIKNMSVFHEGETYEASEIESDICKLDSQIITDNLEDIIYKTPERLQSLEASLVKEKEHFTSGSIKINPKVNPKIDSKGE